MGTWLRDKLVSLGVTNASLVQLGNQPDTDPTLQLPPLVTGGLDVDSTKKTVLIYSHYDVQPVSAPSRPVCHMVGLQDRTNVYLLGTQADATTWAEQNPESPDPFTLKRIKDGETDKLVGRGATDDKGPIMGWLNVLEAHQKQNLQLPVNVRFLFEGMEESGSVGLDDWIGSEVAKGDKSYFAGVDCACIVSISGCCFS